MKSTHPSTLIRTRHFILLAIVAGLAGVIAMLTVHPWAGWPVSVIAFLIMLYLANRFGGKK